MELPDKFRQTQMFIHPALDMSSLIRKFLCPHPDVTLCGTEQLWACHLRNIVEGAA
jgi:hypothetical protein